jgi:PAS domain S-box-containing protein
VENYQEELTKIKTILKNNPKGMTVTDIAHKIDINRNSVAKYLDILLISGHAEMVTFGPAKVYFPSTRIPLSAMLNFTHDYIILLDKDLKFLQTSDTLLKFLDIQRSDIIGRTIDTFSQSFFPLPELAQNAKRALDGSELTIEKRYEHQNRMVYLRIKHIPTTFDDGEPGVTIIIENVTDRKHTEEKMRQAIQEWETTFNSITEMVFIQDNEFSILRANQSFANFLHIRPEECIGKKCYQLLHGISTSHASCPCTQVHQTKKPSIVKFFEPYLDKYLEMSVSPIITDTGEISGAVHIIKDITEQKNIGTIE